MKKVRSNKTLVICEFALLVAVEIVMSVTPLGYLDLPFLSASLLSIPVAIGAIILGTWASTLLGLVFGLSSFIKGFSTTAPMTIAMYSASLPASFAVAPDSTTACESTTAKGMTVASSATRASEAT